MKLVRIKLGRDQRAFTLIELLIAVSIVGLLAGVTVPNVGRHFGSGEVEARMAEKRDVQSALVALMAENDLSHIPCPKSYAVGTAYNDMRNFPDTHSDNTDGDDPDSLPDKARDPNGNSYAYPGDGDGYVLYGHDMAADGSATALVNYLSRMTTRYYYTCESDGTVRQWSGADPSTATEYSD